MPDNNEKDGRTVRMYDRPEDADKPRPNPMMLVLIVVALLVVALLAAKFLFHVHFGLGHMLHSGS